jgi:hypothetical protein
MRRDWERTMADRFDVRSYETGGIMTPEDVSRCPVVVSGAIGVDGALAFDSDEAFYRWGEGTRIGPELPQYRQKLEEIQSRDDRGRSEHLAQTMDAHRQIEATHEALSKSMRMPMDSEEVIRATFDDPSVKQLTPDPITLYEGRGRTGRSITLGIPFPDFRELDFNDVASSLRLFGWGTLCEHIFYERRKHVMLGFPVHTVDDLAVVGFDDTASSYFNGILL